jgi:hypothetical protein
MTVAEFVARRKVAPPPAFHLPHTRSEELEVQQRLDELRDLMARTESAQAQGFAELRAEIVTTNLRVADMTTQFKEFREKSETAIAWAAGWRRATLWIGALVGLAVATEGGKLWVDWLTAWWVRTPKP